MRPYLRVGLTALSLILIVLLTPRLAHAPLPPLCDVTCEPDPNSGTYQGTIKARPLGYNARGSSSLLAPPVRASDAETPTIAGSESYNYAIPFLSLPGRNGLDLNLTLYYNSRVWTIDKLNGTATFNANRDFPSYGFRLGFGYVEGPFTNELEGNSFLLTEPDGAARELRFNSATGLYESFDSSYTDYNSSTKIVRRKDGTQWEYQPVGATEIYRPIKIKDTNGNFISVSYKTEPGFDNQAIYQITDTLGRVVTFNYNASKQLESISGPGFNGTNRTYATFLWGSRSLTYNFSLTVVDSPTSGSSIDTLTRITFTNNTSYNFAYANYWGLVQTIERHGASYALQSSVSYNWPDASVALPDHPTFTTQTVNDGVNTPADWTYSVTKTGGLVSTFSITDPNGLQTKTTLNTSGWQTGLTSQVDLINQTNTYRTIENAWTQDNTSVTYKTNPRLSSVTTTVWDGSVLRSKVEFLYTTYGNVSNFYEYDYGPATPGPLTRQTQTDYLAPSNQTYVNLHILDRPTQVRVYNGVGALKARTDFAYDFGTPTDLSPDAVNWTNPGASRGNLASITRYSSVSPLSGAVTRNFTYDEAGNLRQADLDCCQQRQWTFTYALRYAYPETIISGPSAGPQLTVTRSYDFNTGLVVSATDENLRVTSFNYDSMNRLISVTRPAPFNQPITTSYDDSPSQPTVTRTTPLDISTSRVEITTSDGVGRAVKQETKSGGGVTYSIVETKYDVLGRVTQVCKPHASGSCPASDWTVNSYGDPIGRLTAVTPPGGQGAYAYGYSGNTVTVTDPAGKQRKSVSDALGRLTQVVEPDDAGALSLTTNYSYDVLDNLTQTSQGVQTRTFVYDSMSRLTNATTPEANTVSYTYTSFSAVNTRTDARGVIATHQYDGLNRLTQIDYSTGEPSLQFLYDQSVVWTWNLNNTVGRLVRINRNFGGPNGNLGTVFSYNVLGQVETEYNVNQTPSTVYPNLINSYVYNYAGELTSITYPSGRLVTYTYDAIGRLNSVSAGNPVSPDAYLGVTQYNAAHQPLSLSYGNGVTAGLGYNSRMQLATLSYTKQPNTLFSLSYGYAHPNGGNNGQITSITDNMDALRDLTYTYDTKGRLKTAKAGHDPVPTWQLTWTYDRYGNRTAQTKNFGSPPELSTPTDAATNRVTQIGSATPVYDPSGNLTKDDLNCYTYDMENHLKEVKNLSCTTVNASYTYDTAGLRKRKSVGATLTHYAFSGSKVIAEYTGNYTVTSPTKEYIYAGSQLVATLSGSTPTYVHPDHLSTRLNTSSTGAVTRTFGHYPFGETWYESSTDKWKFTTYERDSESGLDYAMARYDSSRLGRFMSPDPISGDVYNPQRLNRYGYVGNDAINRADPSGLDWFEMLFSAQYHGYYGPDLGMWIMETQTMEWLGEKYWDLPGNWNPVAQDEYRYGLGIISVRIQSFINANGLTMAQAQQYAGMFGFVLVHAGFGITITYEGGASESFGGDKYYLDPLDPNSSLWGIKFYPRSLSEVGFYSPFSTEETAIRFVQSGFVRRFGFHTGYVEFRDTRPECSRHALVHRGGGTMHLDIGNPYSFPFGWVNHVVWDYAGDRLLGRKAADLPCMTDAF